MKLSLAFVGFTMAAEPLGQDDCPNNSWEFVADADGNYCRPLGIQVSCDYRQMEVSFTDAHLYGSLDSDFYGSTDSSASLNDDSCVAISDSDGNYKMTFKLEKCGTVIAQNNGELTFQNRITANTAAATTSGIIVTMPLAFDVKCTYADAFDLTVEDVFIEAEDIDGTTGGEDGETEENGDFGQYFTIKAYSETDYTDEITTDNRVAIGEPVYLEIKEQKAIPNSINFYLQGCTGFMEINDPSTYADSSYQFVDNMCYSDLVQANASPAGPFTSGQDLGYLRMNFAAFSFASETEDNIDIQCRVQLCAVDGDGNPLDANCAANRSCASGYQSSCDSPDCTSL